MAMSVVSAALCLAAAVCCLAALARYVRWRLRWLAVLRPFGGFPVSLPLVGDLLWVAGPIETLLKRGLHLFHRFGCPSVGIWLGEHPWLHLTRPEDLEGLLSSSRQVHKPEVVYKPVSGFFGRGLITLNGEAWRRHRRLLTPAFHFAVLERYSGIFARRAAAFADTLCHEEAGGTSFDFMPHISTFATDTVMETAFGLQDLGDKVRDAAERRDFIRAADSAFQIIARRVTQPWLMLDAIFRLTPLSRQQDKADRIINEYAQRVILLKRREVERRRAQPRPAAEATEEDDNEGDDGVRRKHTFLDMVLGEPSDEAAAALSDEEILNEVRTLIAVQQTSASTLSFVAVCLALHPDVQRLAREEVLRVDAEAAADGLAPLERLNRLKYVERVVKETLRLYPITAVFARTLSEDLVLTDTPTLKGVRDVTLPAGLNVTLFIYNTHRDPRHWPQPERFDPDRFLAERSQGRHPYAYVPFSAGPRNCIGQRYAMLQMKAVVAALLRKVELRPGDGCECREKLPLAMNTFLYIRGGFNVKLRKLSDS